ncbi:MAG: C39 family peptidase [Chloroflexota bacterium]
MRSRTPRTNRNKNDFRWLAAPGIILALGLVLLLASTPAGTASAADGPIFFDNLERLSPDGEWLLRVSARDLGMAGSVIWLSRADGSGMEALVEAEAGTWVTNPVWSADGARIAYLKVIQTEASRYEIGSRFEVWVIRRDGTGNRLVTASRRLNPALGYGGQTDLAWVGDGEIQFEDNSVYPAKVYAAAVETGKLRLVETRPPDLGIAASQPVNVPDFKQCASPWGPQALGTCSETVCYSGCAMTSTSNVFKYYGVQTDPGALNQWLKGHGGYLGGCLIVWSTAANISPDVTYIGSAGQDYNRLRSELDAGYPVIVKVANVTGTHYVTVTGYAGNTYYINDPAYTTRPTLASYGNAFSAMQIYHGPLDACAVTAPLPADYVKCADEGGICAFEGTGNVAFGAGENYKVQTGVAGSIECSTQAFTCDPAHGTPKACYYKVTDALPPAAFAKSAPFNAAQGQSGTVNLSWQASPDATGYAYCVDETWNRECDTAWVDAGAATGVALNGLALGKTYFWQVKALGLGGDAYANDGAWWSFDTIQITPQVTLTVSPSPLQLGAGASAPVTYRFTESAGAAAAYTSYTTQFFTPADAPLSAASGPTPVAINLPSNGAVDFADTVLLPAEVAAAAKDAGAGTIVLRAIFTGESASGQPLAKSVDLPLQILQKLVVRAAKQFDGWILESEAGSGLGGEMDAASPELYLGDDGLNRQYRAILSFFTGKLPDNAVLTSARLKLKYNSTVGAALFDSGASLVVDMRKGLFSASRDLQLTDFNNWAKLNSATFGPTRVKYGWYQAVIQGTPLVYISKKGATQLRVRFSLPTDGDDTPDYLVLSSGDAPTIYRRPILEVTYYVP